MITAFSTSVRAVLGRIPPALLLLAGMFVLHTGSALAVRAFSEAGPLGVTWLRLLWAALILAALGGRPLWRALRAATPRELGAAVILGTASAGMMVLYSAATARIDLGTATALEFLGPLAVAVLALRRRREAVWIAAAAGGVLLLTRPWSSGADLAGVALGASGAVCVALYIVLTQRVGSSFRAVHGLAVAMAVGAVLTAPFGLPPVLAAPETGRVLLVTLVIAVLFPLVPFLLEMVVLQRMGRAAFSTFASLEPAVSLVMGLAVIGQRPAWIQVAGMAVVVAAGVGAARGDRGTPRRPVQRRERTPGEGATAAVPTAPPPAADTRPQARTPQHAG
ncbi:EamA family transporter [Streptomonospora litoralis]|uniref:Threonine/homoserine exporter RhtA n=1 Tax=Streptomonospora litoralis TaxID=2498135 RepID=A0A4P6Q6A6_9ACTN|nr:EamA family transporter [Streptomonospora litoralis]QBI54559.1 Threonine/homoserine exporter RhtA [Streptomonospora litoralis]